MYRRGPSRSTPVNVQCQKCLKRGHYSYECKASAQERPYVPRPSRTQQLLNPKLVPKLASDATDALQETKGLADEELAKREAERAKKREMERDDDDMDEIPPKRERSASYDSISTISTRGPSSPPRRKASRSPPLRPGRADRSPSPTQGPSRRRSFDSGSDYERCYSPNPKGRSSDRGPSEHLRRQTRSASRNSSPRQGRHDTREPSTDRWSMNRRHGKYSQNPSQSPPPENRRRFRSRSPQQERRFGRSPLRHDNRPARPSRGNDRERRRGPPQRDTRKRSLSPFSKRLALTQAMNAGR
ncbi:zinc knuckle-domain-containing protein [Xylariaceae sp. FL1651]|nr:zinc knuckle-domain-containing protein [Xylariaceae sp. FL1651]